MFTSLKKWVRSDEQNKATSPTASVSPKIPTIKPELQKKFSKGVHYNMKIIIRGSRNSGKTTLWSRLQGDKFNEEYSPTPEIQTTSIHWNYKATDDIVKVDVWDVVDKGYTKTPSNTLKLSNEVEKDEVQHKLDASFIDVYKGSHGVIFIFDITNRSSFHYIEKEILNAPTHIPCLILANNRDSGEKRKVYVEEVQYLVEGVARPPGTPAILYLETSMKSGFGLKFIHKFFNLPFLLLQRESLMKQLQINHLDVESCLEELVFEQTSEGHNYENFLQSLKERGNKTQGNKSSSSNLSNSTSPKTTKQINSKESSEKEKKEDATVNDKHISTTDESLQPTTKPPRPSFMSRFFKSSTSTTKEEVSSSSADIDHKVKDVETSVAVSNIDDFVPDSGDVNNFFEDEPSTSPKRLDQQDYEEDSSDEEAGNPMVAGYEDVLDSSSDENVVMTTRKDESSSSEDHDQDFSSVKPTFHQSLEEVQTSPQVVAVDEDLSEDEANPAVMGYEEDIESDYEEQPPIDNYSDEEDLQLTDSYHQPMQDIEDKLASSTGRSDLSPPASTEDHKDSEVLEVAKEVEIMEKEKTQSQTSVDVKDQNDESSDEDEKFNPLVSSVVEDLSEDNLEDFNNTLEVPESPKKGFKISSSDLDFLDQIVTSSSKSPEIQTEVEKEEEKPTKKKKGKSKKNEAGDQVVSEKSVKKSKKKKKKKIVSTEDGAVIATKSKKKKTPKKEDGNDDLEAFLASDI